MGDRLNSLNGRMTAQLDCDIFNGIRNQKSPPGLTVHSDRGSQYYSHEY